MKKPSITIIGAGLAGLTAALELHKNNLEFTLIEGSDKVGGRVRTDLVDGYRLDRGFAVFLEAYPLAKELLNYSELDLKRFKSGTLIRYNNRFIKVSDPWKEPWTVFGTLFSPFGTFGDKLKLLKLRFKVTRPKLEKLFERSNITTIEALKQYGFTDKIIERFFRPFLAGVFFDTELNTSRQVFEFITRMFATGKVSVPAKGIGEIPAQLASKLPTESIKLQTKVQSISNNNDITLENGTTIASDIVIVATDGPEAEKLLPG